MEKRLLLESTSNLVVLLVDMQYDFIDKPEKRKIIPNQISVLRMCHTKGIPVVLIEFRGRGETDRALLEVIKDIPHNNLKKVKKSCDNAFTGTELKNLLKELKVTTLLLMGINACACVYETAVEAVKEGYKIITGDDLISGYCSRCRSDGVRREWYEENSIYLNDHNHILQGLDFNGVTIL